MAYLPIAKTLPQYVDVNGDPYSGAVLKSYADGTTANISFATDNTGGTLVSDVALNASGYPEVSGNPIIPHIDQDYKLSLYPTQAAADANSGAIWTIDNITFNLEVDVSNNKIINLADGTDNTDAINVGQVQNSEFTSLGTTAGSADAYTITASPTITAYATTQEFTVEIHATNTTATPYLQINGITPTSDGTFYKFDGAGNEIPLVAGDLVINQIYRIYRNNANNGWILFSTPQATEDNVGGAEIATQAEVNAGTDDSRIVTPLKLKNLPSRIVQEQILQTGAYTATAAVIPFDNTQPQITEGALLIATGLTPTNVNNLLKIDVVVAHAGSLALQTNTIAIFDSAVSTNALMASSQTIPSSTIASHMAFTFYKVAGTLSSVTISLRGGGSAGTFYLNGNSSGARLGGSLISSLTITEIQQ